jgi:hypothetical protein
VEDEAQNGFLKRKKRKPEDRADWTVAFCVSETLSFGTLVGPIDQK